MGKIRIGTLHGILIVALGLLLSPLMHGTPWALAASDCASCHGADVIEGHHDTTDPNSAYLQENCQLCHVGVTTGNDCSVCHQPAGLANRHHVDIPAGTRCAECHVDAANPTLPAGDPKACAACHYGDAPPKPIRTFHHTRLTAPIYYKDGKLNCAGCHSEAALNNTCSSCHNDPSINRTEHHDFAAANNQACASCHSAIVVPQNCQSCHPAGSKQTSHHDYAKANRFSCSGCHPTLDATGAGTDCARCHTAENNRDFHHETVKTTKNLSCDACHAGAGGSGGTGCAGCHTGGNKPEHHATPTYTAGDCTACHSSTGLQEPGCHSCHHLRLNDPLWREHAHHNFDRVSTTFRLGCRDCHTFLSGDSMPLPMDVDDCVSCHEGVVQNVKGTPANLQPKHHVLTPATAGDCALCHAGSKNVTDCAGCHLGGTTPNAVAVHHTSTPGSDYAAGNCAACHAGISGGQPCSACHTAAPGSTVVSRHHDQYAASRQFGCGDCHTGSQAILQSCSTGGCHTPTGTPVSDRHHTMTVQAQAQNCVACHAGVDQAQLDDCAACHVGPGKPPIAQRHHETTLYQTGNCAGCHLNTEPARIDCAGCHADSSLTKHHSKYVTINNMMQPKPCVDCHKVSLAGNSCAGCHTAPIPQIHHGEPLAAVGGNCGACHQSVNDPSVCANCHTSNPHHATTWSQTGDCAHCHAVPASAADRPAQAACRECHGMTMHDKGGPIQNYGICAACHNTAPFHAYNSGDTGNTWNYSRDDRNRGGSGPGYGKFNMFVSQNSRRGEEGREAPRNKLNFSTKSISHAGRSYTVPYFTGMPSSNLALNKTASASRTESGYGAGLAVDGNATTRWWAKSTSSQWLKVDFGATKTVSKVVLRWHSYYAKSYQIQVSTDNSTWTTVFSNSYGAGGMETRTFTARSARYIRVNCQTASSSNGYSIYELEAFTQ